MKKIFKVASLVLAVMMAAMLSACTAAKKENVEVVDNPYNLVENGKLTVATSPDFAPMEFVDTTKSGQDQYVGFDVTLSKFIADEMGVELVIKPMSFDACQAAVASGTVDLSASGFSWTKERAENYNLSDYYYAGDNETAQTIIVLKEKEGQFSSAADFSGLTVAAQTASLQMNLCTEQLPEDVNIKEFVDIGTAVEALRNGNVDAVAVAEGNGKSIIANNSEVAMSGFMFEVDETAENNVLMLNKNNNALLAKINEILQKAYDNGYYGEWYTLAQQQAGIDTSAEISYDDAGEVAAE